MATSSLNTQRIEKSLIVLSNINELVLHVIREIAGNDISTSLNGTTATADTIRTLTQARLKQKLIG